MRIRKDLHPRDIGKDCAAFSTTCFFMKAHEKFFSFVWCF